MKKLRILDLIGLVLLVAIGLAVGLKAGRLYFHVHDLPDGPPPPPVQITLPMNLDPASEPENQIRIKDTFNIAVVDVDGKLPWREKMTLYDRFTTRFTLVDKKDFVGPLEKPVTIACYVDGKQTDRFDIDRVPFEYPRAFRQEGRGQHTVIFEVESENGLQRKTVPFYKF